MGYKYTVTQRAPKAKVEDGGCARILELAGETDEEQDTDNGVFFRFHSWSDKAEHPEMALFEGRRVRISIEVLDED